MRNVKTYLVLVLAIFVAACSSRGGVNENVEVASVGGVSSSDSVSTSGLSGDSASSSSGLENAVGYSVDNDPLGKRVVYFDYDSSRLTLEGEAIVQAHAQYLVSATNLNVILEGHTDERGTREYNLALGEDRANAVANVLQALGVASHRIQTISYGEERPVTLGNDESSWALNRRVEILYQ